MSDHGVTITVKPGVVKIDEIYLLHNYPGIKIMYMNLVDKNPESCMALGDGEAELLLYMPDSMDSDDSTKVGYSTG